MAATISINFANEQEVYSVNPPDKKSVSAKLLYDVLGGGVVSGGYVRKTGDTMTGQLELASVAPTLSSHAVSKSYVDDHAYTRRYFYECKNTNDTGIVKPGEFILSGYDIYSNPLKFFEKGVGSNDAIYKYMDVYRNGILQVYGSNQDYTIINTSTNFLVGITAIKFNKPFEEGANFQVNIGNVGAYPVTFGVWNLYGEENGGFGVRTSSFSGDVTLFVMPTSFAATSLEVEQGVRNDRVVTPLTLSASRLTAKAFGVFQKDPAYDRDQQETDPYGRERGAANEGEFLPLNAYGISTVKNIGAFQTPRALNLFRVYLTPGVVKDKNYAPIVTASTNDKSSAEDGIFVNVIGSSKTVSEFDFFVYDIWADNPQDIFEFNITIL